MRMWLRQGARLALLLTLPFSLPAAVQAQTKTKPQTDCRLSTHAFARMQIVRLTLQNDRQQRININSHIADEPSERAAGYQHICASVIERTSILFRYPATTAGRFHMHNVKAPLDIGFFDECGVLLQYRVMHPYSADAANQGAEILYGAIQAFQYALEARRGFFKENQLSAGSARLLLETLP